MKLQKITKIDYPDRLSKIIFLNFIHLQNQPDINFSIDDIKATTSSPNQLGWFLIDSSNKIIGYMIGETKELPDGRYIYYLSYFYLVKKYRSKGLGLRMMLNCISYIASINIKFIVLISEVKSKAFKLYKQLGFGDDPVLKLNNSNFTVLLYYTS